MKKYPSLGELIDSGSAQENIWYWVNTNNVNIDIDIASPAWPLREGRNATVIPTSKYFSNYSIVSDGCLGVLLKKITTHEGEAIVISREVSVLHWGKQITPEKSILDAMKVDELQNGVHYFKVNATGNIVVIQPEEVAFLRSYYRVRVLAPYNEKRTISYEKIRPLVASYVIYEYYPSGLMQRRVQIDESGLLSPPDDAKPQTPDPVADDRDKYIEYEVRDRVFNDKGAKQTTPGDEKLTILKDRESPLFVQKILHD